MITHSNLIETILVRGNQRGFQKILLRSTESLCKGFHENYHEFFGSLLFNQFLNWLGSLVRRLTAMLPRISDLELIWKKKKKLFAVKNVAFFQKSRDKRPKQFWVPAKKKPNTMLKGKTGINRSFLLVQHVICLKITKKYEGYSKRKISYFFFSPPYNAT